MSLRHIDAVITACPNPHGEHISIIKALPEAQTEKAILTFPAFPGKVFCNFKRPGLGSCAL